MATTLNFGKLFGKHPFKPMKRHMKLANACAALMPEAIQAFIDGDSNQLQLVKDQVVQYERDADAIFAEIQDRLPSSVFTPVSRHDLMGILEMQERIADRCENILDLLQDLPLVVPEGLSPTMLLLTAKVAEAVSEARQIIKLIDLLLNTNFKGPNVEPMKEKIQDVLVLETEADALSKRICHELFAHRNELDAVSVVFLYKLIGWIDDLADYSEQIAIRSRILLAS